MFLLQLPVWSYVVIGTSVALSLGAWLYLHRPTMSRDNGVDQRRARVAATILRVLNDGHVKRAAGASFR